MSRATATADQIAKLPNWAQAHIREITRQRDEAIDEYNKLTDNQTPSVFYEERITTIEKTKSEKFYLHVNSVSCESDDLYVRVHPPQKWDKEKSIKVYFGRGRDGNKKAVIRPLASNVIEIVPDPYDL